MWPTEWPSAAREIADATDVAVAAARTAEPEPFAEASARLAALDQEQVTVVHASIVRELLEELHPDGLTGDDVQAVLERCARSAASWVTDLDVSVLVVVLTGALGLTDPDEDPRPLARADLPRYATLVIADLLAAADAPGSGYIRRAIGEVARAQTVEMP
ncbi:hypothetical protein ABIC28_001318 [Rhodococcus sp. PvR044]|uniref:hypothetical protein n=1 Tax=Rhodococcus TaxID=1827 RepID=UPI000BC9B9DD|nr:MULTISPECIES: hypothetical protein [Rhodococcus]MBP1161665.1 hypothetical protein [Rhodococcus sp. PvR099]MCZ4555705.1 hypothetical protein [Rhodococcus maanshanensis]PTR38209.1 hypothetical protein C8K38_11899 [Rhodococcus sp. OK611]SNX93141.1 hypothetical protein SAMN05447004_11899 [Rhodococcus sp. OK270]